MGLTPTLVGTYMGGRKGTLGKCETIHVFLINDREIQVILHIINFFLSFSLFFRLKFIILPKNKLFNSNNYGEFQ